METNEEKVFITVTAIIQAPVKKVWKYWTDPKHIIHWNNASDDWHTPKAENDLQAGGKFLSRMEAKDGSSGFDFTGKYDIVELYQSIEYTLDDGRKVQVLFVEKENETIVTENFEAEATNSIELQKTGWQAILDNFKKYVETTKTKVEMHFEKNINANAQTVYNIMLADNTYSVWTSIFNPTSRFIGSWEKGSKILFLGTDENGNVGGMVSRISENIPYKFVGIEHLGIIKDDIEILNGPEVDEWAGVSENYTFTENNGSTLLSVDMGTNEDYEDYFLETYPKALNILKDICEK
jgi:uncharacterized protein YndB with AHSA1/START domain